MSSYPSQQTAIQVPSDASALPMTLPRIVDHWQRGDKLVMVTAYDFPSARAAEAAGVDLVLTTQKDLVKLRLSNLGDARLRALRIGLEILDDPRPLDERLAALVSRARPNPTA